MLTRLAWDLIEGVKFAREVNAHISSFGWAVGLTGSVLFEGGSDNDLDLILYPLKGQTTPYGPAVSRILTKFTCEPKIYHCDHKNNGKLVFRIFDKMHRRVDLIIPSSLSTDLCDNFIIYKEPSMKISP